ncbi:MAG: hypothetical protein ABSB33_08885 [Tepidisphaeraceae bacterium]|jgi:hypothetical protein
MKARTAVNGNRRTTKVSSKKTDYIATVFPGNDEPIPEDVGRMLSELSVGIGMQVLAIVQYGPPCAGCGRETERSQVNGDLYSAVQKILADIPQGRKIAVLLESTGGFAKSAFKIARLIRRHCGGFTAVVPTFAKSAATLLALGADEIVMGPDAELGPLDAQVTDFDREQHLSALEVVQSLERLNEAAVEAVDSQIMIWQSRSRKKIDTLMPVTMHFVAEMMKPLLDKIDMVQYTRYARVLKVAQEYATRLLIPRCDPDAATMIAKALTETFPDHDFAICEEEARNLGIRIAKTDKQLGNFLNKLSARIGGETLIGLIKEVRHDNKKDSSTSAQIDGINGRQGGYSSGGHRHQQIRQNQ